MKRLFFVLLAMVLLPRMAVAQQKMFGYFSYDEAIKEMPEYVLVQENLNDLKSKYDQEMKRVEDEFNRKYEDFLDGRNDFAPTILQKRQTELQELLKKNVAFKAEAQRLLQQAEVDALAPLKKKLQDVLDKIGSERGYAFILNTDGDACPYINPEMGEDVSQLVKEALR
ncbi:MAG: OmpH family outer membrane protein [Prevotella sp.]|jgi:outer membrane protein|nr:OmpH family outer membrane protein [Prevotella sp.]